MVGVPGRSNGCHNCRQRGIKCDGKKPACGNCIKAKRLCSGYQRKYAFILSQGTANSSSGLQEQVSSYNDDPDSGVVLLSRWRVPPKKTPASTASQLRTNAASSSWRWPITPPTPPLWVNPRAVYLNQLMDTYIQQFVPDEVLSTRLAAYGSSAWIWTVRECAKVIPALDNAIIALSIGRLGRLNGEKALIQQSLSFYVRGLRDLRSAVGNPQNYEQVITACLALAMYEVTESPGGKMQGYFAHYRAIMNLVEMRGPRAHQAGLAHVIFRRLRFHSLYQSLLARRKSFFSEPEWLRIPWAYGGKAIHDELMDHLLEMPAIFTRGDVRRAEKDPVEAKRLLLEDFRQCLKLEASLGEWYSRFEATVAGPLYRPELSTMTTAADSADQGKLFPVAFYFPALLIGQTLILYWVALSFIYENLCCLYELVSRVSEPRKTMNSSQLAEGDCKDDNSTSIRGEPFDMSTVPPLGKRAEWPVTTARFVCQSVEYFLQKEMRGMGPAYLAPNLIVIKRCWQRSPGDWSREIMWVDDVLGRIEKLGPSIGV